MFASTDVVLEASIAGNQKQEPPDYEVKDQYLASLYKCILWLSELLQDTKANLLFKSLVLINK